MKPGSKRGSAEGVTPREVEAKGDQRTSSWQSHSNGRDLSIPGVGIGGTRPGLPHYILFLLLLEGLQGRAYCGLIHLAPSPGVGWAGTVHHKLRGLVTCYTLCYTFHAKVSKNFFRERNAEFLK